MRTRPLEASATFMRPNQLEKTSVPSRAFNCVLTRSNTASALSAAMLVSSTSSTGKGNAGIHFPFDATVHLIPLIVPLSPRSERRDHCCFAPMLYAHRFVKGRRELFALRTLLKSISIPPRSDQQELKIFLTLLQPHSSFYSKSTPVPHTEKSVSCPRQLARIGLAQGPSLRWGEHYRS